MEKLYCTFVVKASEDGKTNVIHITSIKTEDGKSYKVPKELQSIAQHAAIIGSAVYANIKNTLKKRHQTRNVWIKMTEDMKKAYWDADGNLMIGGVYPEEIIENEEENNASISENTIADQMAKAFQMIMNNQKSNERPCLRKLAEKFVIEKYNGKGNAHQWLNAFEKECERLDVSRNEEKIEILKVFLDRSCLDWYSAMMIKNTLNSEWDTWKENFCTTYAHKGWSSSKYALSFKYQTGSLLEYALKKEKLMLEVRPSIDEGTLIDIIAAGLPDYISDRINREEILETKDLFNDIGRLEHLATNKSFGNKKNSRSDYKPKVEDKKACGICEGLNKKNRYHPESICWFKANENDRGKKYQIKNVNNSVIEAELNNSDQKNY